MKVIATTRTTQGTGASRRLRRAGDSVEIVRDAQPRRVHIRQPLPHSKFLCQGLRIV